MVTRFGNFIHFALITCMIIAPLRVANAEIVSMATSADVNTPVVQYIANSDNHCRGKLVDIQQDALQNCSCCFDDNQCSDACAYGTPLSLITQVLTATPLFVNEARLQITVHYILNRSLDPPSRPPIKLA